MPLIFVLLFRKQRFRLFCLWGQFSNYDELICHVEKVHDIFNFLFEDNFECKAFRFKNLVTLFSYLPRLASLGYFLNKINAIFCIATNVSAYNFSHIIFAFASLFMRKIIDLFVNCVT